MAKKVDEWTTTDVSIWLKDVGLGKLSDLFIYNEIDGAVLLSMTETDVRSVPLCLTKFGDIRKFSLALQQLKSPDPTVVAIVSTNVQSEENPAKHVQNISKVENVQLVPKVGESTTKVTLSTPKKLPVAAVVNVEVKEKSADVVVCRGTNDEAIAQKNITDDIKSEYERLVDDHFDDLNSMNNKLDDDIIDAESEDDRDETLSVQEMEIERKVHLNQWVETLNAEPEASYNNNNGSLLSNAELAALNDPSKVGQFSKDSLMTERLKNPNPIPGLICPSEPSLQVRVAHQQWTPEDVLPGHLLDVASEKLRPTQPQCQISSIYCKKLSDRTEFWSGVESVYVTHVESPLLFYVMRAKNKDTAFREQTKMNKYYAVHGVSPCRRDNVQLGMACVARFNVDDQLYRGEVREIGETGCEVYFADYGNCQLTSFDQIFPLSKDFGRLHPMCVACTLDRFKAPASGVNESMIEAFEKYVQPWSKMWMVKMSDEMPSTKGQPCPVSFFDPVSASYVQNNILKFLKSLVVVELK